MLPPKWITRSNCSNITWTNWTRTSRGIMRPTIGIPLAPSWTAARFTLGIRLNLKIYSQQVRKSIDPRGRIVSVIFTRRAKSRVQRIKLTIYLNIIVIRKYHSMANRLLLSLCTSHLSSKSKWWRGKLIRRRSTRSLYRLMDPATASRVIHFCWTTTATQTCCMCSFKEADRTIPATRRKRSSWVEPKKTRVSTYCSNSL